MVQYFVCSRHSSIHDNPGPQCKLPFDAKEIEFLLCLVGNDLFDILEHNTNINAVCKKPPVIADPNDEYATSDKYWRPTNADEIKAFVGINILMGLKQLPEYNDYWSNDPVLNDSYIVHSLMHV